MTGYIIYYHDGEKRLSENAGASATTATIAGLLRQTTYSITMVATSDTAHSMETDAVPVTIHEGISLYGSRTKSGRYINF